MSIRHGSGANVRSPPDRRLYRREDRDLVDLLRRQLHEAGDSEFGVVYVNPAVQRAVREFVGDAQHMSHPALADKDRIVRQREAASKARYLNHRLTPGNRGERHGIAISQLAFMHHNRMRHIQIADNDMVRRIKVEAFVWAKFGQVDRDDPARFIYRV